MISSFDFGDGQIVYFYGFSNFWSFPPFDTLIGTFIFSKFHPYVVWKLGYYFQ